ncbi:MAG: Cardiolipin synthetase [Myxococcaceae bacterium]|nr:Cardiolipin synthetase [Myxococcaceae bacterium]
MASKVQQLRACTMAVALGLAACGSNAVPAASAPASTLAPAPSAKPALAFVSLVESAPVETTLDHASIPNAHVVWLDMIERAEKRLDLAEFYVSDGAPGNRLAPILDAIEKAAARGVAVRLLVENEFASKYPDTLARLEGKPGIQVRRFKVGPLMGGILHAKYFVVDDREAYLGSQNFDWRSLEHIQEIGVHVRHAGVAQALADVFDTDWDLAGGALASARHKRTHAQPEGVRLVASPKGFLPDEAAWELPQIISGIDAAKKSVHVQVLTYRAGSRDGSPFRDLDDALRRAAARGVEVHLLVANWSKRGESKASIDELAHVPGVTVRVITIPDPSSGPIPFARVAHAKYMVTDGAHAWVGTSNWEGDYFTRSRNVGVWLDGGAIPGELEVVFNDGWSGVYASPW